MKPLEDNKLIDNTLYYYLTPSDWPAPRFYGQTKSKQQGVPICPFVSSQLANIGPQDFSRMSLSNVSRMSPKDPIWPSLGHLDLTSRGQPDLTSWECPEMMSRRRPNLTLKERLKHDLTPRTEFMSYIKLRLSWNLCPTEIKSCVQAIKPREIYVLHKLKIWGRSAQGRAEQLATGRHLCCAKGFFNTKLKKITLTYESNTKLEKNSTKLRN